MDYKSETRRVWIFILFAFGIAWLTALVIAFPGSFSRESWHFSL